MFNLLESSYLLEIANPLLDVLGMKGVLFNDEVDGSVKFSNFA